MRHTDDVSAVATVSTVATVSIRAVHATWLPVTSLKRTELRDNNASSLLASNSENPAQELFPSGDANAKTKKRIYDNKKVVVRIGVAPHFLLYKFGKKY